MEMNMKNLNVFRRLDELETQQLHMQVVLKVARAEIESLKAVLRLRSEPKAAPAPAVKAVKSEDALDKAVERKRAYARAYYAKKKAEPKGAWQSPEYEHKGAK